MRAAFQKTLIPYFPVPLPRGVRGGFEHSLEPHALARTRRGLQARTRATRPRKNA